MTIKTKECLKCGYRSFVKIYIRKGDKFVIGNQIRCEHCKNVTTDGEDE
jgi:Zn ribbon nucleic-acid-binding protein